MYNLFSFEYFLSGSVSIINQMDTSNNNEEHDEVATLQAAVQNSPENPLNYMKLLDYLKKNNSSKVAILYHSVLYQQLKPFIFIDSGQNAQVLELRKVYEQIAVPKFSFWIDWVCEIDPSIDFDWKSVFQQALHSCPHITIAVRYSNMLNEVHDEGKMVGKYFILFCFK